MERELYKSDLVKEMQQIDENIEDAPRIIFGTLNDVDQMDSEPREFFGICDGAS